MKSGSIIAFNSKYDTRHLLTKPLHYGIQLVTGSKFHHLGILCDGWYYEAMASTGVRKIKLEQKLMEIDDCVKPFIFTLEKALTKAEEEALKKDLDKQVGKQYSAWQAFLSILTAIIVFNRDDIKTKTMFCSKLVFYAMRNLQPSKLNHFLPRDINPEECIKLLKVYRLIKEGIFL